MAAGNKNELLDQARRSIHDARRELTSEARWLREELDPRRIAHRTVDQHTTGVLVSAFAAGLAAAWLIFHKHGARAEHQPKATAKTKVHYENGAPARSRSRPGLASTLVKAAVPVALKFATSKPVMEKIMGYTRQVTAHRARPAA